MDELDFDTAAQELEKSIKQEGENSNVDLSAVLKSLTPDEVATAVKEYGLKKAKGKGPTSDLTLEEGKDKDNLTGTDKDPAESPKKSGQGYPDVAKYTKTAKADDLDEDEDEDEDDKPKFFKKKSKKIKKSEEIDADDDEDEVDATEFMEDMADAVEYLGKSIDRIEKGLAIFGELLVENTDPAKDRLLVSMAKAIQSWNTRFDKIEKSLEGQSNLVKAIASTPGRPKIAGIETDVLIKAESSKNSGDELSKSEKNQLFGLRAGKTITFEDYQQGLQDAAFARQLLGKK